MSMVCPDCRETFEQALLCPKCGVRLHYHPSSHTDDGEGHAAWQHTPWGRVLVGILVAQGLVHGMQMLCNAGLLASGEDSSRTVWQTLFGLVLFQALHCISLIIGGALTGAGQVRGGLLGAMVGVGSGSVFLIIQKASGESMTEVTSYGQPLLAVIFGAFGGLIGSLVWKPLPALRVPGLAASPAAKGQLHRKARPGWFSGPVAWLRVLLGIGLVFAGVLWPQRILDFVLEAGRGQLRLESHLQAKIVTWEIAGVLMFLGGAFAGATTRTGLKHGVLVGLGAGVVLLGHTLATNLDAIEPTVLLVGSVFVLSAVGGWFGGELLPPVVARSRSRVGSIMT